MNFTAKHQQRLSFLVEKARETSWERFGKRITLYLPGMFVLDGRRGRYPAISLSGRRCALMCDHCFGKLLERMLSVQGPRALLELCKRLDAQGVLGCLITAGSDSQGRLPWERFIGSIEEIKKTTSLHISVHTGMIDRHTARRLKEAGVDQALVDVVGSDETIRGVLHLEGGMRLMRETLEALYFSGLDVVPHIVVGLHYGKILGEWRAVEILKDFGARRVVFVVLMPLRGTPMEGISVPAVEDIGRLMATARLMMPETEFALGCARPRGRMRIQLEHMAIDCGINRMALYSEEAIERASRYGLEIFFSPTCCSLDAPQERSGIPKPSLLRAGIFP